MTYYQLFSNDFRQQLLKNNFSTSFSLATVMNTPPIGALALTVVITERAWFDVSPQIFSINNPLNIKQHNPLFSFSSEKKQLLVKY